jgi:hypothetical protein
MSKSLTLEQRRMLEVCDPDYIDAMVVRKALSLIDYLERKVKAADEVMDVIRPTLPLLACHYDEVVE